MLITSCMRSASSSMHLVLKNFLNLEHGAGNFLSFLEDSSINKNYDKKLIINFLKSIYFKIKVISFFIILKFSVMCLAVDFNYLKKPYIIYN